MTIALTVILTAALLILAWLLGQLTIVASRLAVVFALSWLGYGAVWLADSRDVSDVVRVGIMIGCAIGAIVAALFVLSPLKTGLDDYFYNLDVQEEPEP